MCQNDVYYILLVDPVQKPFLNSLIHLNGELFYNTFLCYPIMPKVNFFEIPFDDAERVTKFYSKVYGWEIEKILQLVLIITSYIPGMMMMVMIPFRHHHIHGE